MFQAEEPRPPQEFCARYSRAIVRSRIKLRGVVGAGKGKGNIIGEKRQKVSWRIQDQVCVWREALLMGSLLIRVPFCNGGWGKANEETDPSLVLKSHIL